MATRIPQTMECQTNQMKIIDISNTRFGRLIALKINIEKSHRRAHWNCICDCGNTLTVNGTQLRSGHTKSCGCLSRDNLIKAATRHGHARRGKITSEYNIWQKAKKRVINPKTQHYNHYGGRGIKMCKRWLDSFQNFLSDMGYRPSTEHSIDRINNDGDYEPSNCRWATKLQQSLNTRRNVRIEYLGKNMTVSEWSKHFGMCRDTITDRLRRNIPIELIFIKP